jgi:hypothetical protein
MFIAVAVIANTVALALSRYNMSTAWEASLAIVNIVFTAIFAMEIIVKLTGMLMRAGGSIVPSFTPTTDANTVMWMFALLPGLGIRLYLCNVPNLLDIAVVGLSVIEILLGKCPHTLTHTHTHSHTHTHTLAHTHPHPPRR